MTYKEFRERVNGRLQALGARMDDLNPNPASASDVASFLTGALRLWTGSAQTIWVEEAAFTVTDGARRYSISGSAFARPFHRVDQIRTPEGIALTALDGLPGPINTRELETLEMTWIKAAEGTPRHFARTGGDVILFPTPDATSSSWSASGLGLHPAVSLDADLVLLDPLDEEAAVMMAAADWALRTQYSQDLAAARAAGFQGAQIAKARTTDRRDPSRGGVSPIRRIW